jgi:outer membrane lipoprotein-sorting protein
MRNVYRKAVWTALCVAALASSIGALPWSAQAADDLAPVFAKMDEAAPKFKGMRADMKKVSHTAVINEDATDVGSIVVKVPKPHDYRMLMTFDKPDEKLVGVAGTKIEVYLPKAREVQEYDAKGHKAEVEQFLKLGFGSNSKELRDSFTVTYGGEETVAGEKTWRIVLAPKSQDVANMFTKFELWISQKTGISVQQKMYEKGGNYSLATYPNMKPDANVKDSEVKLVLPAGVTRRKM